MQAVFFDLFETLITEKTRPDYATRPSFNARLEIPPERLQQWWEANGDSCMVGRFADCASSFRALCRDTGSPLPAAVIDRIAAEQERWKIKVLATADPAAVELLKTLRQRGFKVGLLSNALPEEEQAWAQCPLRHHVDAALFSCSSKTMKPQKSFYLEACQRLKVEPAQTYFVGDGGYDELRGARAAGLSPIQALWYVPKEVAWPYDEALPQAKSMMAVPRLMGL